MPSPIVTPETEAQAGAERPVVAGLRAHLETRRMFGIDGSYWYDNLTRDDQAELFYGHVEDTTAYVAGFQDKKGPAGITPEEALGVLFDVGKVFIDGAVKEGAFASVIERGLHPHYDKEAVEEARRQVRESLRNQFLAKITPEAKAADADGEQASFKDRFSTVWKALQKKRKEGQSAKAADEREKALASTTDVSQEDEPASATNDSTPENSEDNTSVRAYLFAEAESHFAQLREKNLFLRTSVALANKRDGALGSIGRFFTKEQAFDLDVLAKENPRAHGEITILQEKIAKAEAALNVHRTKYDFNEADPAYQATLKVQQARQQTLATKEAALVERKLNKRRLIATGIGIVGVAAAAVYVSKYGFALPGSGDRKSDQLTDHFQPKGGNDKADAANQAHSGTTAPGNTDVTEVLPQRPKGVNREAFDSLTTDQQVEFVEDYNNLSGDQQTVFNEFADGVQSLHAHYPDATPQEFNEIVDNTLRLAWERDHSTGSAIPGLGRLVSQAIFDENFQRYLEESSKVAN